MKYQKIASSVLMALFIAQSIVQMVVIGEDENGHSLRGVDLSPVDISPTKDIDDPSGTIIWPTGKTQINVTVKNFGDSTADAVDVNLTVEKGDKIYKYNFNAEGGSAGWKILDYTAISHWHLIDSEKYDGNYSAWCGGYGEVGTQYSSYWEEQLILNKTISLSGTTSPTLTFYHKYNTIFNTDGGFLEIYNSNTGKWERMNASTNWSFIQGGYDSRTSMINKISKSVPCFAGNSGDWITSVVSLDKYKGFGIKVRFWFSSGKSVGVGWFIDNVTIADGSNILFHDSFENGMGNWTTKNLISPIGPGWHVANKNNPNTPGSKCLWNGNSSSGKYDNGIDSVMISPEIDLKGVDAARLYFWHNYSTEGSNDGGFVEISDDGITWKYIKPFMSKYPSTIDSTSPYGMLYAYGGKSNGWVMAVFDLTEYIDKSIRIRFHFYANGMGNDVGWLIDDITVAAWNFSPIWTNTTSLTDISSQSSKVAKFIVNFEKEGYHRIIAQSKYTPDDNIKNDTISMIISVKDIYLYELVPEAHNISIKHGASAQINYTLQSHGNKPNSINFTVGNIPDNWKVKVTKNNPISLAPESSIKIGVIIEVPIYEKNTTYTLTINTTSNIKDNLSISMELNVTVVNNPPIAKAGMNKTAPVFSEVTFDASQSYDPDGDELNYTWDFGDGNISYGKVVKHTYTKRGNYTVKLNVSDGGFMSFDVDTIYAHIYDNPPKAVITVSEPLIGKYKIDEKITFSAKKSEDEGPLTYFWEMGDGNTTTEEEFVYSYSKGGIYQVNLTVTDIEGQSNTTSKLIHVNRLPVVIISEPKQGAWYYAGVPVLFSANDTYDPDNDTLEYIWTCSELGDEFTNHSRYFYYRFTEPGQYNIMLTVKDWKDSSNSTIMTISIHERVNSAPALTDPKVTPESGDEATIFNFTVIYTDKDNDAPIIWLIVDGLKNTMREVDPSDRNYTDGKEYYYLMKGTGFNHSIYPHTFRFVCDDKRGHVVSTDVMAGPDIKHIGTLSYKFVLAEIYLIGVIDLSINVIPAEHVPERMKDVGLCFQIVLTNTTERTKIFWANITILFKNWGNFTNVNKSTIKVYQMKNGEISWEVVALQGTVPDGVWFNITNVIGYRFAVFGEKIEKEEEVLEGKKEEKDYTMYYIAGLIVILIIVGAVIAIVKKRAPVAPEEPIYEVEEEIEEEEKKKVEKKEEEGVEEVPTSPEDVVSAEGEEVKIFRPGAPTEEVEVFHPKEAEEVKIFKPVESEKEAKIMEIEETKEPSVEEIEEKEEKEEEKHEKMVKNNKKDSKEKTAEKEVEEQN